MTEYVQLPEAGSSSWRFSISNTYVRRRKEEAETDADRIPYEQIAMVLDW